MYSYYISAHFYLNVNEFLIIGDLMRLSIENMGRLLENPRRCAENNIVNMIAPVYLTRYLEKTQQSNPETKREARRLFMLGTSECITKEL